jgi:SAM-dependent methyltransferase
MRGFSRDALELIRCGRDGGRLNVISPAYAKQTVNGQVRCECCSKIYRIQEGILDMMGSDTPEDKDSRHEFALREGTHQLLRGTSGSRPSWRDVAEIECTMRRVGDPAGKTVLELGCGPGIYTRRLAAAKCLLAIDFSLTVLRQNQTRLPVEVPVGLVRADVGRLFLAPEAFDLALTTLYSNLPTNTLRYACNQTVAAALRPGGRYIVSAHHQDQRRMLKGLPDSGYYSEGGIFFQCFTGQMLRTELHAFEVEAIEPICVELPVISRLPSDYLRAYIAQRAAWVPVLSRFGSILLASARKANPPSANHEQIGVD